MLLKKLLLGISLLLFGISAEAQVTAYYANINSGLFTFRGPRAASASIINSGSYTNNPYGTQWGPTFGLSLGINRSNAYHFIFGAEVGYELLQSSIKIDGVSDGLGFILPAKGKTKINQNFVNLFPYTGYRFRVQKVLIDAGVGFDIAYGFKLMENGRAITNDDRHYLTRVDRDQTVDLRPRVFLAGAYTHYQASLSYAHGTIPYDNGVIGVSNIGIYARIIRIGLTYKL